MKKQYIIGLVVDYLHTIGFFRPLLGLLFWTLRTNPCWTPLLTRPLHRLFCEPLKRNRKKSFLEKSWCKPNRICAQPFHPHRIQVQILDFLRRLTFIKIIFNNRSTRCNVIIADIQNKLVVQRADVEELSLTGRGQVFQAATTGWDFVTRHIFYLECWAHFWLTSFAVELCEERFLIEAGHEIRCVQSDFHDALMKLFIGPSGKLCKSNDIDDNSNCK
jgi:hypothetical protein